MVKAYYTSQDKRLPTSLARIQQSVRDVQRPTGTEKSRALLQLEAAFDELADQQARLEAQQTRIERMLERIEDASKIFTQAVGTLHTGASWMPSPPSVSATSLSRKFRITITGGSTGGATILTFSGPGYNRERAIGGSAEATLARATALGGMSDPGTAQRSWIVTMPTAGPHTFSAQARPSDQYVTAVGLQIDVQPVL